MSRSSGICAASFGTDLPSGPWGQPPAQAALLPIAASGETGRGGVLVVGLNPFRLYDEGYRGFLGLVAGQIGAAIAHAEAYEEERRRAEALAEVDRAKTAFFSNVSHEFRTPLTLMLGPLEELLSRPAEGERAADRPLINTVHHNGLRLLKLVNSLLDFSRIEAGRVQAHYQPTDLDGLSAELASSFRSAIDQAGLRLTIDCPALGEPVYVDRDMWEQIVLNLLSNAFKFTLEGEIAVRIKPSADGTMAELAVIDTGTGVPAAELPSPFERFHRIRVPRAGPLREAGSASPSCRSWSGCTKARSASKANPAGGANSPSRCPLALRNCRATTSSARARPRPARAPKPMSKRR